jgi:hypothetical protein
MSSDDDRWYRQQLGAAGLGLVAGLVVVVPAVLWLSGWLGGPQTKAAGRQAPPDPVAAATIKMAEVKPVKVRPIERGESASQYQMATADPRVTLEPPPQPVVEKVPVSVPAPKAVEPPRPRVEDVLALAERRIGNGDIGGAREVLTAGESIAPGPITFALAETYDPNMLAAWGTRGVSADVTKARALYFRARDLGVGRAQARLDQLK